MAQAIERGPELGGRARGSGRNERVAVGGELEERKVPGAGDLTGEGGPLHQKARDKQCIADTVSIRGARDRLEAERGAGRAGRAQPRGLGPVLVRWAGDTRHVHLVVGGVGEAGVVPVAGDGRQKLD